jgi:hypothetical protein
MANVVLVLVNNARRMLPVLVVNNRMSLSKMELVIKLVKCGCRTFIRSFLIDIGFD